MEEPIIVTGAIGGYPNRLEINDFIKDEKFFSLYIQALQAMYNEDQNDRESFFQISGIHARPYIPWDGVGVPEKGEFCVHRSVLFPTWHRPYMMLYEQTLQKHAISIAATYTIDPEGWKQAAIDLRQPFWDYAIYSIPPDEMIELKQVTITRWDGERIKVDNPLHHYTFHPIDPTFDTPHRNWQTTLRYPTNVDPDATDNIDKLREILGLEQTRTNIRRDAYTMLTRIHNWPDLSKVATDPDSENLSDTNSLEGIHINLHGFAGGKPVGHMATIDYAGFDPIFYFHHASIDRLLYLWSALNPGVWVTPWKSEDGTIVDTNTELKPFRKAKNTFWSSSGLEDTRKLGYTYPDFNGIKEPGNPDAVREWISNRVNLLYGRDLSSTPSPECPDHGAWDWIVRMEFKSFEYNGMGFYVYIFLGEVPENFQDWDSCNNYVGSAFAFVNSVPERCSNCISQQDLFVEQFVHLDPAIVRHGGLRSLEPDVVEPYLTNSLKWKVQKLNGEPADLQSLQVCVIATPLTYPPGTKFPVPGPPLHFNGITHGKPGGCRHA